MIKISKYVSIFERCANVYRNYEFNDIGLSGNHHLYLFYINRYEGISQEKLVNKMHINKSNVARSIKTLESEGFIIRREDEHDKRANKVYLSEKGKAIIPLVKEKMMAFNQIVLEDFTDEEKEMLEKLLLKATKNAANYIDENYEEE